MGDAKLTKMTVGDFPQRSENHCSFEHISHAILVERYYFYNIYGSHHANANVWSRLVPKTNAISIEY